MFVVFLLCITIILLILKNNKNAKGFVIAAPIVFMDGRIYDIIKTNFVSFKLIVPSFVVEDLETELYPLSLPGDKILVHLVKEGEQHNQAIGYFDDKTKNIAEDAKRFIEKNIDLEITSVMFTPTGKVIFGKPEGQVK
jgi:uncharacterized protein YacL